MTARPAAAARHVLPSYAERTPYGHKETNPYDKLFEERIVFLGTAIDDAAANDVIAQLFTLEFMDPDRDISVYINSPGGSHTAMTAIYDTMQFVRCRIQTVCVGQAAGPAAVLLAAGTPGRRAALPHARILLHQPATEGTRGQASDIEIQAEEILRVRAQIETLLARHTGQDADRVGRDIERDRFLTPERARTYGIVDEVIASRKRSRYALT
ncbi:ATP-dependent Clp protease proteolytic subunit [Actinoallomurus iriomotensis]|uniref:ATP-dependent Clp protease proteolytic subunit n=1 Tax=Actinoallomurus iriomotensis TaxID=478107 RepID=A0A9W6W5N0_9ACTN|nr:ATP-dependent Clp protease proteolytic subunit [Actinoallomurus iriomotensis]GLY90216.1 ATP-dependent Clp protease proteolytic subunit [Actinoallomurus iriomotensis]